MKFVSFIGFVALSVLVRAAPAPETQSTVVDDVDADVASAIDAEVASAIDADAASAIDADVASAIDADVASAIDADAAAPVFDDANDIPHKRFPHEAVDDISQVGRCIEDIFIAHLRDRSERRGPGQYAEYLAIADVRNDIMEIAQTIKKITKEVKAAIASGNVKANIADFLEHVKSVVEAKVHAANPTLKPVVEKVKSAIDRLIARADDFGMDLYCRLYLDFQRLGFCLPLRGHFHEIIYFFPCLKMVAESGPGLFPNLHHHPDFYLCNRD